MAVNWCRAPAGTEREDGVTVIDCSTPPPETVTVAEPLTVPTVALTVPVPDATAVAFPVAFTVTTEVSDDAHVAVAFTFRLLPSLKVPVAVN